METGPGVPHRAGFSPVQCRGAPRGQKASAHGAAARAFSARWSNLLNPAQRSTPAGRRFWICGRDEISKWRNRRRPAALPQTTKAAGPTISGALPTTCQRPCVHKSPRARRRASSAGCAPCRIRGEIACVGRPRRRRQAQTETAEWAGAAQQAGTLPGLDGVQPIGRCDQAGLRARIGAMPLRRLFCRHARWSILPGDFPRWRSLQATMGLPGEQPTIAAAGRYCQAAAEGQSRNRPLPRRTTPAHPIA
jgi:hypothetical protein